MVMDNSRRSAAPPIEPTGRVCTVCSDRANGYNFGVLTCESCKAFFRRNAAKQNEIQCPFSNSCQITSASRKFCQACRLNKCFGVGMTSDWLNDSRPKNSGSTKLKRKKAEMKSQDQMKVEEMDEDDGKGVMESKEEQVSVPKAFLEKLINKAKGKPKDHCTCTCQCGYYPSTQRLVAASEVQLTSNLQHHEFTQPQQHSDTFTYSSSSTSLSPVSTISISMSSNDSRYSTPHQVSLSPVNCRTSPPSKNNYTTEQSPQVENQYPQILSPFGPNPLCPIPQMVPSSIASIQFPPMPERTWTPAAPLVSEDSQKVPPPELLAKIHKKIQKYSEVLSQYEMSLLEELHLQNEPLNAPLSVWHNPKNIDGVFKIIEEALGRIVSMACQLNLFRALLPEDKMTLLKSCFGELLIVRGLMAYDKGDNSWIHSFGVRGKMEVKVDVLNNPELSEHYEAHKGLLDTFGDDVRNNENLMLIFNAAVIFHPNNTNLRESYRVHNTHGIYFQMLLKLLIFEFGPVRGDIFYKNLLNQVVELHLVNRSLLRVFYGLDVARLDPLVRELVSKEYPSDFSFNPSDFSFESK